MIEDAMKTGNTFRSSRMLLALFCLGLVSGPFALGQRSDEEIMKDLGFSWLERRAIPFFNFAGEVVGAVDNAVFDGIHTRGAPTERKQFGYSASRDDGIFFLSRIYQDPSTGKYFVHLNRGEVLSGVEPLPPDLDLGGYGPHSTPYTAQAAEWHPIELSQICRAHIGTTAGLRRETFEDVSDVRHELTVLDSRSGRSLLGWRLHNALSMVHLDSIPCQEVPTNSPGPVVSVKRLLGLPTHTYATRVKFGGKLLSISSRDPSRLEIDGKEMRQAFPGKLMGLYLFSGRVFALLSATDGTKSVYALGKSHWLPIAKDTDITIAISNLRDVPVLALRDSAGAVWQLRSDLDLEGGLPGPYFLNTGAGVVADLWPVGDSDGFVAPRRRQISNEDDFESVWWTQPAVTSEEVGPTKALLSKRSLAAVPTIPFE